MEVNEEINKIENIDTKMKFLKEHAYFLFKNENIKNLRMSYVDNYDKTKKILRIYFNDSLCLWFYEKDGKLDFDGWEVGDYRKEK